jgi:hypothetical protein
MAVALDGHDGRVHPPRPGGGGGAWGAPPVGALSTCLSLLPRLMAQASRLCPTPPHHAAGGGTQRSQSSRRGRRERERGGRGGRGGTRRDAEGKTRRSEGREAAKAVYLDRVKGRGRQRRVAKWAGLVVCLLIVAAWCASIRWGFGYGTVLSSRYSCYVAAGALSLVYRGGAAPLDPSQWSSWAHDSQVDWWPMWENYSPFGTWYMQQQFTLPLWMPFVLLGIPTAWLWWRDRRRARIGHCTCGYDLAGLAAGAACPECGKSDTVTRGPGDKVTS